MAIQSTIASADNLEIMTVSETILSAWKLTVYPTLCYTFGFWCAEQEFVSPLFFRFQILALQMRPVFMCFYFIWQEKHSYIHKSCLIFSSIFVYVFRTNGQTLKLNRGLSSIEKGRFLFEDFFYLLWCGST